MALIIDGRHLVGIVKLRAKEPLLVTETVEITDWLGDSDRNEEEWEGALISNAPSADDDATCSEVSFLEEQI